MGMLTFLVAFEAKKKYLCTHSAGDNSFSHIFTHFYTEQRQHTIDADEGKPALDEQQELNSIFECSSNAAQVSIT